MQQGSGGMQVSIGQCIWHQHVSDDCTCMSRAAHCADVCPARKARRCRYADGMAMTCIIAPVGKQAEVLNILLEDLLEGHAVSETKLKEVLGHTPIQVHMLSRICCKCASTDIELLMRTQFDCQMPCNMVLDLGTHATLFLHCFQQTYSEDTTHAEDGWFSAGVCWCSSWSLGRSFLSHSYNHSSCLKAQSATSKCASVGSLPIIVPKCNSTVTWFCSLAASCDYMPEVWYQRPFPLLYLSSLSPSSF